MSTLIIGRDEDLCCQLVRERLLHSGEDVLYLPEITCLSRPEAGLAL